MFWANELVQQSLTREEGSRCEDRTLQQFLISKHKSSHYLLEGEEDALAWTSYRVDLGEVVVFDLSVKLLHLPGFHLGIPSEFSDPLQSLPGHLPEGIRVFHRYIKGVLAVGEVALFFDLEDILVALAAEEDAVPGQLFQELLGVAAQGGVSSVPFHARQACAGFFRILQGSCELAPMSQLDRLLGPHLDAACSGGSGLLQFPPSERTLRRLDQPRRPQLSAISLAVSGQPEGEYAVGGVGLRAGGFVSQAELFGAVSQHMQQIQHGAESVVVLLQIIQTPALLQRRKFLQLLAGLGLGLLEGGQLGEGRIGVLAALAATGLRAGESGVVALAVSLLTARFLAVATFFGQTAVPQAHLLPSALVLAQLQLTHFLGVLAAAALAPLAAVPSR